MATDNAINDAIEIIEGMDSDSAEELEQSLTITADALENARESLEELIANIEVVDDEAFNNDAQVYGVIDLYPDRVALAREKSNIEEDLYVVRELQEQVGGRLYELEVTG